MGNNKLAVFIAFVVIINVVILFHMSGILERSQSTRARDISKFFHSKGLPPRRSLNSSLVEGVYISTTSTNSSSAFLYRIVIILPTMGRLSYLEKSIRSYLQILTADDLIVIFAVKNQDLIVQMLSSKFPNHFNDSIIVETGNPIRQHLLSKPCELSSFHNDSLGRVLWRSSIVLEHAWMLYRVSFLQPEYVLVMEEDVLIGTEMSFLNEVQQKLRGSPAESSWNMLHLRNYRRVSVAPTHLGGAFGLLINASCPSGILSASAFLLRYFDDSPVDWLMGLYFWRIGGAFGVRASDLVIHIGETSTKNFADNVNGREHCQQIKVDTCPTVMTQTDRHCDTPMVWQVPASAALELWSQKFREAGVVL